MVLKTCINKEKQKRKKCVCVRLNIAINLIVEHLIIFPSDAPFKGPILKFICPNLVQSLRPKAEAEARYQYLLKNVLVSIEYQYELCRDTQDLKN